MASFDESRRSNGPPGGSAAGALRRLARITLKEQREILRDRRTIITLVLMPLLLYPLLGVAFRQLFLTTFAEQPEPVYRIGFGTQTEADFVLAYMSLAALPESDGKPTDETEVTVTVDPKLKPFVTEDLNESLRAGLVDLGVRSGRTVMPSSFDPANDLALDVELLIREGSSLGLQAADHVRERLRAANDRFLGTRLRALGIGQRAVPIESTMVEIPAPDMAPAAVSLTAVVPLILILMTITGAVYPAIDLTAGERERGTLEILVAAPVPRLRLLLAKYVAVLTVAILTAGINLVTMCVTLLSTGLGPTLFGPEGLSAVTVLQVFLLLLLFAAFFSAVLLVLCSFARSFKEAQAYLVPLMLVSMAPGMAALIPGLTLTGFLPIAPLINIVLLARDLFDHTVDPSAAVMVVVSTLAYAALAIGGAARLFGAEGVLYGAQASWADLFRRPSRERDTPSIQSAMLCLALAFPAFFVANGAIAGMAGFSISARLLLAGGVTGLVCGGLPLLVISMGRIRFASGLRLRGFTPIAVPAAILLGLSLWTFMHEIMLLQQKLGFMTLGAETIERTKALLEQFGKVSPVVLVFSIAVMPAIFEELFFRGMLFNALLAKQTAWTAIATSALLFGVFHLVATDSLTFERLIPSTLLGVVLAWICWRTGSVFPGMLLHACHNGFVILVARYKDELASMGLGVEEQSHLPASWLAGGLLATVTGIGFIQFFCQPPEEPTGADLDAMRTGEA